MHIRDQRANRNKPMARNSDPYRLVVCRDLCRASSAKSGSTAKLPTLIHAPRFKGKVQERESETRRVVEIFERVHGKQKKPRRAWEAGQKGEESKSLKHEFNILKG